MPLSSLFTKMSMGMSDLDVMQKKKMCKVIVEVNTAVLRCIYMSKSCHKKFLQFVTLTNNFGAKTEQLLRRLLSLLLMATAFCKNVPKYGTWCINSSLKHAVKF